MYIVLISDYSDDSFPEFLVSLCAALELDATIQEQGWQKQANGVVFISKKEAATAKPKKVVEQLDFDSKSIYFTCL